MRLFSLLLVSACLVSGPAIAGTVSGTYFDLAPGSTIDLTATGPLDWIKFANGENGSNSFFVTTKIGNPVFFSSSLDVGGDPDVDFFTVTGQGVLNFTWTDGNFGMYNGAGPVDTVVAQTLNPPAAIYPIGLTMNFEAGAVAAPRLMNVYLQGFDADIRITATMSGGGTASVEVSPTHNPPADPNNIYAIGNYQIVYAGAGETINVLVETIGRTNGNENAFANAGIYAATVEQLVPEPSTASLAVLAFLAVVWVPLHRVHRRVATA